MHLLSVFRSGVRATAVSLVLCSMGAMATRVSHVESNTVNNGDGSYTYNFTVFNDSHPFTGAGCGEANRLGTAAVIDPNDCLLHRITEWSMPYFSDSAISNFQSPTTLFSNEPIPSWAVGIETIGVANNVTGYTGETPTWQIPGDPFYFGATSPFSSATQILRWYTIDICGDGCFRLLGPGESLSGFSFDSTFAATAAPYDAGWRDEMLRSGDPDFPVGAIPNSPSVNAPDNGVPTPAPFVLLGLGLVVAALTKRRAQ
jgi:hypothetical protein